MALAEAKIKPRMKVRYDQEIAPQLREQFGYKSPMQIPNLVKITVNMGVGDAKQDTNVLTAASEQLQTLTGQKPNIRRARKSIANFKLREEMPVGVAVTLRQARMWEFFDRLTSIAIPRIRDFRGLNPKSFDGRGNYNMGVREQIIFPEIDYDAVDQVRGLDINITTTATTDEEAFALLSALGMPFRRDDTGGGPTAAELRAEQDRKAKAEAEEAALEQLKEENPEAYAKPEPEPAEGEEAADGGETPAEPAGDQET
jgi:large subunit ribosomal protein L5